MEAEATGVGAREAHDGEEDGEDDAITASRSTSMPKVDRFFAALEGPELDKLKSSEELVLPSDKKWPFLLRFPVSAFGICLGVSSQAILWKTIATSAPIVPPPATRASACAGLGSVEFSMIIFKKRMNLVCASSNYLRNVFFL